MIGACIIPLFLINILHINLEQNIIGIGSPVNLAKVGFAISLTHTLYATVAGIKKVDRDRIKAFLYLIL